MKFRDPLESERFREDPGLYTAGDYLGQVITSGLGATDAAEAAQYVRDHGDSGPALRALADRLLGTPDASDDVARAAEPFDRESAVRRATEMRRILRAQPRNAVRWTDLALVHVNLGQLQAAARDMQIAVSLAADNRFVLRSASRLQALLGDPERGLALLRGSPLLGADPWLQSAEISLSELAGRPTKLIRSAKRLLSAGDYSPFHLSELAGEVATTELRHGSTRAAKKLMRTALIDPTENTVAQAEWASQHGIENPDPTMLLLPRSFEARAIDLYAKGEYIGAVAEALKWQGDQPFDTEAGIFVSYTASTMLERYDLGVMAAQQALRANPTNSMLLNNLVFGLASSGRVKEAKRHLTSLSAIAVEGHSAATVEATRGLVAFRSGDAEGGRAHYRLAIERFGRLGDRDFAAMATVFLAREELLAEPRAAGAVLSDGITRADASSLPEAKMWASRLRELARSAGLPA